MSIEDLKNFIDLGGVFILALIFINQLSKKFDNIECRLYKLITLVLLALEDKIKKSDIEDLFSDSELKVLNKKS